MKTISKWVLFFITLLFLVIIYYFSLRTGEETLDDSMKIARFILERLYQKNYAHMQLVFVNDLTRLIAHIVLYLSLGILAGIWVNLYKYRINKTIFTIVVIIICICIGFIDEFLKQYVPGRHFDLKDVVINTLSSITGIFTINFFYYLKHNMRQKKN